MPGTTAEFAAGPRVLARLVAPAALERAWAREPVLTRAADLPGDGFADLLDADAVDEAVAARGLRAPLFRLVRQGETVAGTHRTQRAGGRDVADFAHPDRVREEWAGGATLVLNALHRWHPPLVTFCRRLATDLGHPVQCNAYVTPPGRARGFRFHSDTHDVLVAQVDGTKRWTVHPPRTPLPLAGQGEAGDHLVAAGAAPLLDTELTPGDVLYLPRGFVHAASTTDERSVHLTFGLPATTWHDVLRDVVDLGREQEFLRGSLPLRPLEPADDGTDHGPDGGPSRVEQALPDALRALADWVEGLGPADVLPRLRRRLEAAEPLEPLGTLAQQRAAERLGADTPVRPREGLQVEVRDAGPGRCALVLPDRVVEVPAEVAPAVRRALRAPCTPQALGDGDAAPGDLGVDVVDAVVLVRRLLREGALAPA